MEYLLVKNGNFLERISRLTIIITFLSIQRITADCTYQLNPFYTSNITQNSTPYLENHTFIQTSKECNLDLTEFASSPVDACSDSDVEISLIPRSHFPNGTNLHPYITLNISVVAFVKIERLFIEFKCVMAQDAEDVYCHDDTKFNLDGRKIWPCRELILNVVDGVNVSSVPFYFSMDCFHLFGLSQYQVDITIAPKSCRKSFIVSIPLARQLEPKMLDYFKYTDDEKNMLNKRIEWSPLIYAEVTPGFSSGVWIRFETMPWIYKTSHTFVSIMIFERNYGSQDTHLLFTKRIAPTYKGFKWENVPAGEYLLFVFVEGYDCYLNCTSAAPNLPSLHERFPVGCKICPHTFLNFTITEDKFTPEWERSTKFIGIAKGAAIAILATLFVAVLSLIAIIGYLRVWVPRQLARQPPISVELTESPTVFLLYTDDCEEHSNAVAALGRVLAHNANTRVIIDQNDLQDPSIRPSVWLLNSIAEAKFIVIVFSEGAQRVMQGERLSPRRPFPDLFNSALGYVITKISEIDSRNGIVTLSSSVRQVKSRDENAKHINAEQGQALLQSHQKENESNAKKEKSERFIAVRFAYSPAAVVPEFFANERFGHFVIPQDLGRLMGRIHGVANDNRFANFEHTADISELTAAINSFENLAINNPLWLKQRLEAKENRESELQSADEQKYMEGELRLVDRLEKLRASKDGKAVPSVEEQEMIAAKYGLYVPTDEETVLEDFNVVADHSQSQTNGNIQKNVKFDLTGDVDKFRPRSISAITSSSYDSSE